MEFSLKLSWDTCECPEFFFLFFFKSPEHPDYAFLLIFRFVFHSPGMMPSTKGQYLDLQNVVSVNFTMASIFWHKVKSCISYNRFQIRQKHK